MRTKRRLARVCAATLLALMFWLPAQAEGALGYRFDFSDKSVYHESSGTGGTRRRDTFPASAEREEGDPFASQLDPETKRPLALSDVFYDGFNYIDYLNRALADQYRMNDDIAGDEDYDEGPDILMKRPFGGFPRDYRFFELVKSSPGSVGIRLWLDSDNPYFVVGADKTDWIALTLGHDVSPWGACVVERISRERIFPNWLDREAIARVLALLYDEQDAEIYNQLGGKEPLLIPTLRIDAGAHPEAQRKINDAIQDAVRRLKTDLYAWDIFNAADTITPEFSPWQGLLFFRIPVAKGGARGTYATYFPFSCVLEYGVYDLHTGDLVPVDGWLALCADIPNVKYYDGERPMHIADLEALIKERIAATEEPWEVSNAELEDYESRYVEGSFGTEGEDWYRTAATYTPPPGTRAVGAWEAWIDFAPPEGTQDDDTDSEGQTALVLELREPDGTPVRMTVPFAEFEKRYLRSQEKGEMQGGGVL